MAAGPWTFTNTALTSVLNGTFDFDTDDFKVALFTSAVTLNASTTTYASISANEVAGANGYTTGGFDVPTLTLSGTTTKVVDSATDPSWTASGGSITARYAVLYEVGGNVVCYCLLDTTPADVTVTDGNTLTIQLHANGFFTLTAA